MAGTVNNPKRVRFEANERLDTVDVDALSKTPREHDVALTRARFATPRASGGAQAPGTILTGFELTLNPTGPTDGKVRVGTNAAVAIDSDGRTIVKPAGTTYDVTVPVGTYQLYAYYTETDLTAATRRFLSVTPPYVESSRTINTEYQGTVGFYTRSGNATNWVGEDTVNGETKSLVALGVVTNAGGACTITGYHATTAPNGTDITNRMNTATPATTAPTVSSRNGSPATLMEMVQNLAHQVGQVAWKGSAGLTPSASNNYGAWSTPAGGVDAAFRGVLGFVTIGNGSTIVGDFNTTDYANANALLAAAIASLPATGGTIILKRGVALSGFNNATVSLPASKTVEIIGDHSDVPSTTPQLTFNTSESLTASASGRLILRNLHIRYVTNAVIANGAPVRLYDVHFEKNAAAVYSGAAVQGTSFTDVHCERVTMSTNVSAGTTNAVGFRCTGQASRVRLLNVRATFPGFEAGVIDISDVRTDVFIDDIRAEEPVSNGGTLPGVVSVGSTDNATQIGNRFIRRVYTPSQAFVGVRLGNIGHVEIEDLDCGGLTTLATAYAGLGPVVFRRHRGLGVTLPGAWSDLHMIECTYIGQGSQIGDASSAQGHITLDRCTFVQDAAYNGVPVWIRGSTINKVNVKTCEFRGIGSTSSTDCACVKITAGTRINQLIFDGNEIFDFMNKAWAGSNSYFRIFEVNTQNCLSVLCHNNTAFDVMNGGSGAARQGAYLLELNSADRATATAVFGEIKFTDNKVGNYNPSVGAKFSSAMLIMGSNYVQLGSLMIDNNQLIVEHSTAAGDATLSHFINFATSATVTIMASWITINENRIRVAQGGGTGLTNMPFSVINITKGGGTPNLYSLSIQNNNWHFDNSAPSFDLVNGYGINIPSQTTFNLIFRGNSASYTLGGPGTWFKFRFTGAATNALPALPGSGVAFSDNISIVRS